ncbi:hypothetical protein CYLTODRAFT_460177 [Cylindrobasidium torrendii FP15055 ss-10]|uniref:Uncharacterized protein n=1 Tax=Cylindrobasidium torrendii FP15055 ss-10 TaxID=1314674 RepID=A0A0D7ARR4_9AGAR|nr:hypothetical protein CYLTODRAFT_460177 [Cylindrobasidium torrendii FP15055 ss-10]
MRNVPPITLRELHPAILAARAVCDHLEGQFNTLARGKKHTTPKKEKDVLKLRGLIEMGGHYIYVEGRKVSKQDKARDFLEEAPLGCQAAPVEYPTGILKMVAVSNSRFGWFLDHRMFLGVAAFTRPKVKSDEYLSELTSGACVCWCAGCACPLENASTEQLWEGLCLQGYETYPQRTHSLLMPTQVAVTPRSSDTNVFGDLLALPACD